MRDKRVKKPRNGLTKLSEMYDMVVEARTKRDRARDLAKQMVVFIRSVRFEIDPGSRRCADQLLETYNKLYIYKEKV